MFSRNSILVLSAVTGIAAVAVWRSHVKAPVLESDSHHLNGESTLQTSRGEALEAKGTATSQGAQTAAAKAGTNSSIRFGAVSEKSRAPDVRRSPRFNEARDAMSRMFPDLPSALGLTQSQAAELLDLLAVHQIQAQDNAPTLQPEDYQWDPSNKPAWLLDAESAEEQRNRELLSLLGGEKYKEWMLYKETWGARLQVRQLREQLAATDDPLRDEQFEPLLTALAEAERDYRANLESRKTSTGIAGFKNNSERIAGFNAIVTETGIRNQYLRDAASAYLGPEQLNQFNSMLDAALDTAKGNLAVAKRQ